MLLKSNVEKWVGLIVVLSLLLLLVCSSVVYGYTDTSWKVALDSFTSFNGSNEHLILQTVRLPRAFIAAAVGASLAISGVLLQTLTKNPLASSEFFGVNAGAGLAVVIAVAIYHSSNLQLFTWVSFFGAAVAAICVFAVGSVGREGLTPMKLTLAGAALTAMFASLTQGLLVINEAALEQVLFWLSGSVAGRKLENLMSVLPYLSFGWVIALIISGKLNVFAMGEDVAKGLGLNTGFIKVIAVIIVILLSGGAVAVAGQIAFIGIVIPHVTRAIVGTDHRWLIPYSALLGGILLIAADIAARYIVMPEEMPVGVMTAIIGTPFFIYLARRGFNGR
ncbi:iron ABC transporter permease [Bacillus sp. T3]|uniref:FecCD family ABC transporter permease n=1 Tax=Bacillus sp. T3 TaxID=467262 RepID=UPI002982A13A|nr:iron ABC transporter permease [Bacillus sp. T3]